MTEQPHPEQTVDLSASERSLDAGLAAAFGPDSGPPLPADGSVLQALSIQSAISLRDPDGGPLTPVIRPCSENMPQPPPPPTGRLQLHGEIAHGGMGAVLKGRDTDLGRDIAVKVLLEKHHGKIELVQRFVEEAQIAGQLQHPGVTPVYELGAFPDRRPYFTMKLVKGQTLAALLAARKDPAEDRSKFVGIFAQVCQTLAYAHARGVIHRDLKPSNVMVGAFGEVQVMDWGLAKVLPQDGVADEHKAQTEQVGSVIRTLRSAGSGTPDEAGSHTHAGSVLGTPSYMAPEQARGATDLVDERADVFGLGSILCEVLTGQPPFVGKTAEAHRKAQTAKLADAYARLDGCGAEAELVALARHCLAAEPWERPRHAGKVAEAVTTYQESVAQRLRRAELAHAAEVARAAEAQAKAQAERRARRLRLALAASLLLAGTLGAAGWRWVELERVGRAKALDARVNAALQEAVRLHGQAQGARVGDLAPWAAAVAAAWKVEALLEPGVDPSLRQQTETLLAEVCAGEGQAEAAVRAAERDRVLQDRLVDIRSARADDPYGTATDAAYAEAFREAGIDVAGLPPAEAGARLRARPPAVALALAAALDDWAAVRRDKRKDMTGATRLTEAAQVADPDPWRQQLRAALALPDKEARLAALRVAARTARLDELGAVSLDLLGTALSAAGDAAAAEKVLRAAQQRHPGDVWVNYDLAQVLEKLNRLEEAIRYYVAARSIRPETAHALAHALEARGESDEAIVVFQGLARLRPGNGRHLGCLGRALQGRGRSQEAGVVLEAAVAALREQIRLNPDDASAHTILGNALTAQGKLGDAVAAYREAIRLQPDDAAVHTNLGIVLHEQGKLDDAIASHRQALRLRPDDVVAHTNLGNALVAQGKLGDAVAAYREAIRLEPDYPLAHTNLGVALYEQGKLDDAIASHRHTIRLKPDDVVAHHNLGNALAAQGKLDEAVACYREAIRLKPDFAKAHGALGLALLRQGLFAEARAATRRALDLLPANAPLRKVVVPQLQQCERLLALDHLLPLVLRGQADPVNASVRVELALLCLQHKQVPGAAVRFFTEAFAEQPRLADDLQAQHRYNAACAAALAGTGKGQDDSPSDDAAKARLRRQARDWLGADLAAYAKLLDGNNPQVRGAVEQRLQHWQKDADLAGLRDKDAVAKLPAEEQEACQKLWAEVEALLQKAREKTK
jgi:serine/threonine-protein kinase